MKKYPVHLFLAAALTLVILAADCSKSGKKETAAPADRVRLKVTTAVAVRRTIDRERKVLGSLAAYRETDLAPMAPGRVRSLPFKIGDRVAKGQTVALMDDAQLVGLIAQFQPLKAQYERSQVLQASNAISKSQFEAVEAQYVAMKRQVESLQENTAIKAPFAGVVTARAVEEGELYSPPMMASPGQSRGLVRITQLDPLKVDLDVDDQTVTHVKKGMQVKLSVDQVPDSAGVIGKVEWVNPQADAASRTFAVRVVLPNSRQLLRPGYFAEVHIILDEKKDALTVPRQAVVDERVFVVRDSIALSRKVTLGWVTDDLAEILSGVEANDVVVVTGNKALPDSAVVEVKK